MSRYTDYNPRRNVRTTETTYTVRGGGDDDSFPQRTHHESRFSSGGSGSDRMARRLADIEREFDDDTRRQFGDRFKNDAGSGSGGTRFYSETRTVGPPGAEKTHHYSSRGDDPSTRRTETSRREDPKPSVAESRRSDYSGSADRYKAPERTQEYKGSDSHTKVSAEDKEKKDYEKAIQDFLNDKDINPEFAGKQ